MTFLKLFVLAATSVTIASSQFSFHENKALIQNFLSDVGFTGTESIPELRSKLLKKIGDFAHDIIQHPEQNEKQVFQWFDHEIYSSFQLQNVGPSREILSSGEGNEAKTMEHYWQSVQHTIQKHLPHLQNMSISEDQDPENWKPAGFDPYPFFGFIPFFEGSLVPNGQPLTWSAPCFQNNVATAKATTNSDGSVVIDIEVSVSFPTSLTCADRYLLGTLDGIMFKSFFLHGSHNFQWKISANTSEDHTWDALNKGIRFNRFAHDPIQLLVDIYETAALFVQALTNPLPSESSNGRNLYFLKEYSRIQPNMKARFIKDVVIDEDLIQNGDFFGVVRLDGLDPMLAWAMGATTGHTTIAIRDPYENDRLYVAESTTKDAYWPTNGLQRTPFQQWIKQARAAGYNVVHAPLAPEYRAKFNSTKAMDYFRQVEGLDYGYYNMLWSWVDTLNDNYPCVPPDFQRCLVWDHMELVFGWMDLLVPDIADKLFAQAFNHRLGTFNLRAPSLFRKQIEAGYIHGELPAMVEQDTWLYNTTRFGKSAIGESHVCCTFVCNTWKVAGIFEEINDQVNCNEFTNWDAFSLKIFDADRTHDKRPQQCIDADPENALCQLVGDFTLNLNDFNTKPMFAHMAEKCQSKSPVYARDQNC